MENSEPQGAFLTPRREWAYAFRRAYHGFMLHRGIDSAATLAFFAALTILPAALSIVSAFAIAQGKEQAADTVLDLADEILKPATLDLFTEPLTQLFSVGSPVLALIIGVALSVWSLSSYATAFGRAANSVYEIQEGRRFVKFRGLMLVLSAFLLIAFAAVVTLLLTTTRVATAIAEALGFGEPWITIWAYGRWPVLAAILTMIIAVLYYYTPNVRHDRMRWVSTGALFAIIAWGLATTGFGFYVSTIANYDRVYGWLGGALAVLIWLYISNLALVAGIEVDAEFTRLRQLLAGVPAENTVQLPLRDTYRNLVLARRQAADETRGIAIRNRSTE
ncbi:YihY/virulence factor BrkB family protein [Salinibacterium sp. UTAS2018]|uniref:YihY/virulence factor BrkB family protein n=1 Tax=Salinibacterium sp. UTAS2018 TaxID=2508880 RepID=UPI001009482D|nr:YihY/virulence factor BrkB family protein [Salinibacterium sp. UTAS2018]QAV70299.1 YihY/virulence factor BrkB family protein [Salinibacterium sp. UTAS2018]